MSSETRLAPSGSAGRITSSRQESGGIRVGGPTAPAKETVGPPAHAILTTKVCWGGNRGGRLPTTPLACYPSGFVPRRDILTLDRVLPRQGSTVSISHLSVPESKRTIVEFDEKPIAHKPIKGRAHRLGVRRASHDRP
jgi:hypothetical protein